ncbi:P-II family nitrogen regulator [Fodinibius sp. SL11]|uniref:P-II family nitrogen regulator n=1 Tax=Fodinibius sp. SL11 TaxID=3425690 RepID=UPI003F884A26
MKLIKAYIRAKLLEDVYCSLRNEGYSSMTVFEGEGTGRYSDPDKQHGSLNFPAMHTHVVKIEIAAKAGQISSILQIIQENGRTGRKGDGIIFVTSIEQVYRIRDGKEGAEILN